MKKISIMIPCWNEEENIRQIVETVKGILETELQNYDYEIVIIDNKSIDNTREIVRKLCKENHKIKAIFNVKNFGQFNSPFYGLMQCNGDCVIPIAADFQDPVELIPDMVHKWEDGHKVICMIKSQSEENKIMYFLRDMYYKIIQKMSSVKQIKQFTGFGLYDKSFIEILKQLKDATPFIRGIIAEYAPDHYDMEFTQPKRKAGKSSNNFMSLYDAAILSFTSYTNCLRIATFMGFLSSIISFAMGIIYLIMKLINWSGFDAGTAPMLIAIFFLGGVILLFMGMLGEYVISMNKRVINRPLVLVEEKSCT